MCGIDHGTGAAPTGALDDCKETVVRMAVGNVETVRFEAIDVNVKAPGLGWIAGEQSLVDAGRIGLPFELIGRHVGDGGRVEFHGMRASRKAKGGGDECGVEAQQTVEH
jgi:hypothetical protein